MNSLSQCIIIAGLGIVSNQISMMFYVFTFFLGGAVNKLKIISIWLSNISMLAIFIHLFPVERELNKCIIIRIWVLRQYIIEY